MYAVGQIVGATALGAVLAWLIIREVIKIVRYNIIRKNEGTEAAKEFWDAKKTSRSN